MVNNASYGHLCALRTSLPHYNGPATTAPLAPCSVGHTAQVILLYNHPP